MLNPFSGKNLEELEIIRKAKTSTVERQLAYITLIDKEIEEQRLKRNVTSVFRALTGKN